MDLFPVVGVCPKLFALSVDVVRDNSVCGGKDVARGTVILFKTDGLYVIIGLVEAKYVFDRRTAEGIYRLIVIAHNANVFVLARKERNELALRRVRILIFVNEYVFKLLAVDIKHVAMCFKKTVGEHYDIVKVKCVCTLELFLIFFINQRHALVVKVKPRIERKFLGRAVGFLRHRDDVHNMLRRKQRFGNVEIFYNSDYKLFAIVCIVNGKIVFIAQSVDKSAQYSHTDRMEGACPDVTRGISESFFQALLEFLCRLVCKGNAKHPIRMCRLDGAHFEHFADVFPFAVFNNRSHHRNEIVDVLRKCVIARRASEKDDVCNTVDDNGGFTASCPRKHEQRALCRKNRFPLLGV